YFPLTPGILPSALRAGFAVRTRSCACVATQRESNSVAEGDRPLFALSAAKSIARKRAPTEVFDCSAPVQHPPPPKSLDACLRRHDGVHGAVMDGGRNSPTSMNAASPSDCVGYECFQHTTIANDGVSRDTARLAVTAGYAIEWNNLLPGVQSRNQGVLSFRVRPIGCCWPQRGRWINGRPQAPG